MSCNIDHMTDQDQFWFWGVILLFRTALRFSSSFFLGGFGTEDFFEDLRRVVFSTCSKHDLHSTVILHCVNSFHLLSSREKPLITRSKDSVVFRVTTRFFSSTAYKVCQGCCDCVLLSLKTVFLSYNKKPSRLTRFRCFYLFSEESVLG